MMVARTIGKYRFVEKVGRGGMGTVYRAVDETLERDVAIKVLNSEITEPEVLKRFRAEALMLARLSHPGIAAVYDLHQQDGELFMVMEFVRGETFQQLSERLGQLRLDQAIGLASQALDALAYAHRVAIVHRDLKPSNLMLADSGLVKVMDFGIARIVGSEHLTGDGSMMGTPAYMSPEQVRGDEVDGRADLYSMAVVLYRLLAAKLPFDADTAIAFAQKQLYDPPTPIKEARPDLPPQCEAVLARALEKSPRDRFQTAEEFRDALVASASPALGTPLVVAGLAGDAMTCTVPTPVGTLRRAALATANQNVEPETRRTAAALESTTQRTVVISGKYFFAGTATIVLLLVALLAAIVIVARRPLGLPTADQIAARLAPATERPAAPAPAQTSDPKAAAPAQPVAPPPQPAPSQPRADNAVPKLPVTTQSRPSPATGQTTTAAAKTAVPPIAAPAAPAAPPTPSAAATLPAASFDRMKLLVIDGSRSREQDARIHLADGRILIIAVGDRLVASIPYADVVTLSSSRSRQPRWRNADGTEGTTDLHGGAFGFLKSDRTWIAIQTHEHTYVLRAERDDISPLARAAAERTGVPIQTIAAK